MKKITNYISVLFLIVLVSSCCTGKNTYLCKAKFSAAGGINFSNISEDDENGYGGSDNTSRLGYQIGANALLPLGGNFSLQPGLGIASKGKKNKFESEGGEFGESVFSVEETTSLTYLEIPILARYQFDNTGFNAFGGLQPSLLLNAKQKNDDNMQSDQSVDVKNQFKTFDTAAVFGVGFGFANGIILNAQYDLGLIDINDNTSFGNTKLRNRSFKISLAYQFN